MKYKIQKFQYNLFLEFYQIKILFFAETKLHLHVMIKRIPNWKQSSF